MGQRREHQGNFKKINEKVNTTYQNVWEAAKAMIWGNFIAVNALIEKKKSNQYANLIL